MTNSIVFARDGQALTTSEAIATGVNIQHKNILAVLRNYQADFETFNPLAFETRKGVALPQGGFAKSTVYALLSEQQATLLVTYCKNTATVRKFKVALVKAFYEMRMQLQTPALACDTITPTEQHAIQVAVAKRARRTASNYQTIYRAIKNRYQIARYDQLPRGQFQECLAFIDEVELSVPVRIPVGFVPGNGQGVYLNHEEANILRGFVYSINYQFKKDFVMMYKFLREADSPRAPRFYDAFNMLASLFLERILSRAGYDVKDLECYKHWAEQN